MAKKPTMSDIAREAGVTASTVQRALGDIPGVSEEKRLEIKKIAERMGYQRNVMAKMLKKRDLSIAFVLPEPNYYAQRLWDGVHRCLAENAGFAFTCHRFEYERSPENLAAALERVCGEAAGQLSGVLTMGEPTEEVHAACQKLRERNIPVFFVGTEGLESDRLCCSRVHDDLAGKMAADLLLLCAPAEKPLKIMITGDFSISDQYFNMQGFESILMQRSAVCEIIKLSSQMDAAQVEQSLLERLARETDITAIYSTSAQNSIAMGNAVAQAGLKSQIKLIGSDLFPQSQQLLEEGRLDAVIHKRPSLQAFEACQALINHIVYGVQPQSNLYCCPVIVTRSNIPYADTI